MFNQLAKDIRLLNESSCLAAALDVLNFGTVLAQFCYVMLHFLGQT